MLAVCDQKHFCIKEFINMIMLSDDKSLIQCFPLSGHILTVALNLHNKAVRKQRYYRLGNNLNENGVGTEVPCLLKSRAMIVKTISKV